LYFTAAVLQKCYNKLLQNLSTDPKLTFLIAAGILFHKNFAFALQIIQPTDYNSTRNSGIAEKPVQCAA